MPCEVNTRFVILYGSQKGQAQSIAEGIAVEAEDHGLVAELSCLNQSEKYNLEKEKAPVVFIVSTTGDGEPPDNALQFVKGIKKKTLSTDHYKHLCYALLALGDTNYANFCNCGKTIERRLQALGAKQFYVTGYADDGVGLEVVVDPWLEGLWKAIKGALSKMASDKVDPLKGPVGDSPKQDPDSLLPDVELNLLSLNDHQNYTHKDGGAPHVPLAASLTCSLPPLSQSSLNVPALPPPYLHVSLQDVDSREQVRNDVADEDIPIERAIQLTTGDLVKTSLLLELDTSAYPTMTYLPGDSFDVFCPNRATEVEDMLCRLGLQDKKHHQVHVSLNKDTKKKGKVQHLPKLQPRPYSAASSCLKHPGKLHFVFNVVEFSACSGRPVGRRGLCTGWLFDLINPGKPKCSGSHALPKIHVSLRPKCSFRLPSDLSVPFVMVGPGTGVAPFIGFLQQREKERQDNPEAVFGETWLFFGCRYRDRDYLFREELEGFVTSGVLDHLKVSFSRDELEMEGNEVTTSVARPRYVQHNLLLHRQQITEILLKKNGCLYVCGDAKNMAKDVNDTLIEIIKTQLQVDQLEAMKTLAGLREEKRYLQDIWG
uniref:Methionine synthase reductase n=1 Tax=Echeneis naucrates TaxID=173247 RepID=A0A665VEV8_ECHNA